MFFDLKKTIEHQDTKKWHDHGVNPVDIVLYHMSKPIDKKRLSQVINKFLSC